MSTLTLYCRAPNEAAWSRLNTITYGSETNDSDRKGARIAAERIINRYRAAWAHTLLPDHEFLVDDGARWPVPVIAQAEPAEQRIPEPAL